MEQQSVWIRFSVRGKDIQTGSPYGWRAFVGKNPEIHLKGWFVEGLSSRKNPVPAFTRDKDEYDVLAWVAYFGKYSIKDDVMCIKLKKPTSLPPWQVQQ